jgi:hypothetical protein
MMFLRKLFRSLRGHEHVLEPIQPRVKPDPEAVEALERQRAKLAYRPEHGFLVEPRMGESA